MLVKFFMPLLILSFTGYSLHGIKRMSQVAVRRCVPKRHVHSHPLYRRLYDIKPITHSPVHIKIAGNASLPPLHHAIQHDDLTEVKGIIKFFHYYFPLGHIGRLLFAKDRFDRTPLNYVWRDRGDAMYQYVFSQMEMFDFKDSISFIDQKNSWDGLKNSDGYFELRDAIILKNVQQVCTILECLLAYLQPVLGKEEASAYLRGYVNAHVAGKSLLECADDEVTTALLQSFCV